MGKRGSGLSLQYLATLNLIFVTDSRALEPLGVHLFTSTKYSINFLCFTVGIYGKSQVGLLEKGKAFPFPNYSHIWFFPCIRRGAIGTCTSIRDNWAAQQRYWVCCYEWLGKSSSINSSSLLEKFSQTAVAGQFARIVRKQTWNKTRHLHFYFKRAMLLERPAQAETSCFWYLSSDISEIIIIIDWPQDLFQVYKIFMMNSCS